jgi:serine/threonine-protein kinase
VDFRSDVWSLGVVLYELVTARVPFVGVTVPELCAAIVRGDFARPSGWGALPEGLRRIIGRCLEKDREARYASVSELREALSSVLLALARPPARPAGARTPRKSGALLVLASVMAGGLSFAGVVVIFDRATAATPVERSAAPAVAPPLSAEVAQKLARNVGGLPPKVTPVMPDVAVEPQASLAAESAMVCAGVPLAESASPPQGRVPLRVHSGAHRATPTAAQGWLWLERDEGRAELAHQEIVSPYPSKPWAPP